ncbi:hypothetical protein [Methanosarcina mazei]|uniref:hypothetical protein n=1 Tax=Methanosarcina mazei TaxID=2209 RepID=UPI0012D4B27B|nr:hypothetical protein [Methanosarcina mazei]
MIEKRFATTKEKIGMLRQFIFAKAFSGELVETEAEMQEGKAGVMKRLRFCLRG